MADTKISALTVLSGAGSTEDADELPIVDASDTTMGASGTTKAISVADLSTAVFERPLPEFTTSSPTAPAAGVKFFTRSRGGRRLPAYIGPSNVANEVQPNLGENNVAFLKPSGNGTVLTSVGIVVTAGGTATAANWANTSLLASVRRLSYISAATAGASGGFREAVLKYWRGNSAGLGGWQLMWRFGFATIPATRRWFVGLYGITTAPANANPSSFVNMVGVGQDVADTEIQFMHNDGTGTATKSSSGVASPAANEVLEVRMYAAPNASSVQMSVQKLNGGTAADYTSGASVDLPANTQGLALHFWANNGTTAAAIDPQLVSLYVETDY